MSIKFSSLQIKSSDDELDEEEIKNETIKNTFYNKFLGRLSKNIGRSKSI